MHARFTRRLILTLAISSVVGCAGGAKTKTQKQEAQAQWNGTRAAVLYSLASDQYRAGNFGKCRETLGRALQMDAGNARLLVLSARLDIEDGRLEAADRTLRLAATSDPGDAEIDYLQGVVQQRWQRPQLALVCYARAAEKRSDDVAYPLAQAEMLVALDRRSEATRLLLSRVAYFEHSATIRDAIGQLLQQSGAIAQAVEFYRQASVLDPDDLGTRERLGVALFQSGQWRDAQAQFDRVVSASRTQTPGDERATAASAGTPRTDLMLAAAECELALDEPAAARRRFDDVRVLEPTNADAWLGVAKASLALSDPRRAEAAAAKAVTLRPRSADAQVVLGYAYLRQRQYEAAMGAFARANACDPADGLSLSMMGLVAEQQGRPEAAQAYFRQALALEPTDPLAGRLVAGAGE